MISLGISRKSKEVIIEELTKIIDAQLLLIEWCEQELEKMGSISCDPANEGLKKIIELIKCSEEKEMMIIAAKRTIEFISSQREEVRKSVSVVEETSV